MTRRAKPRKRPAPPPVAATADTPPNPVARYGPWIAALVGLLVYANTIFNGFAYDDVRVIQTNPRLQSPDRWAQIWTRHYWSHSGGRDLLYRPVTLQSYALNYLAGPEPWHFHLVNVLLFGAVCGGLCLLATAVFDDALIGAAAALLFAVHPIHTEAVANVVGRGELLAAAFMLLALGMWHRDGQASRPRRTGALLPVIGALAALAAMLSKEHGLSLVPIAVLLDWWWSRRSADRVAFWRSRLLRGYLPLTAAVVVYFAARNAACGAILSGHGPERFSNCLVAAAPLTRVLTPFKLLAWYLRLFLLPTGLCADYSLGTPILAESMSDPAALAGIALTVCGIASAIRSLRRKKQWFLLAGFFALAYLLVSNSVLLIGTIMGERLFFWPSVPLCLAVANGAVLASRLRTADRPLLKPALCVWSGLVVLGALAAASVLRNGDWKDNETLARAGYAVNPHSARILYGYGAVLRNDAAELMSSDPLRARRVLGQAIDVLERAVGIFAWNDNWWVPLGYGYAMAGQLDKGLEALRIGRMIQGPRPSQYNNTVYYRLLSAADGHRTQATRPAPSGLTAEVLQLLAASDYPRALPLLQTAHRDHPNKESPAIELARAYFAVGRPAEAVKTLRDFFKGHPRAARAGMLLARVLAIGPDAPRALRFAEQALAADPADPYQQIQYAEVLAATGHRDRAVARYRKIIERFADDKWPKDIARTRIADLSVRR